MHARSAVVDLFGDHLPAHGWWAPVAGLVELAEATGVQPPATRTAVSRLVREGWLRASSRDGARGYEATPLARGRLLGAHERIYATGPPPWDGSWQLVVVDHGGDRRRRDQVTASLTYLGYGRLSPTTWISPRPSTELPATLRGHGARWSAVTGPLESSVAESGAALAAQVWDLEGLDRAYLGFASALPLTDDVRHLPPERAYPLRAELVHEWRKFLFSDPGLPAQVLPARWSGQEARARFLAVAAALRPAADAYVSQVLTGRSR